MKDSPKRGRNRNTEKRGKTTIVGGRPPGPGRQRGRIPRGIEVLIKKASVDPAFRQVLLEKRAEAANGIGLELSPAEVAMLNAVPPAQIEKTIENTTVPDPQRRLFLGKMGAAMVAALTLGLSGCDDRIETTAEDDRIIEVPITCLVEVGVRATLPPPLTATPSTSPVQTPAPSKPPTVISQGTSTLDVNVVDEGANSATVLVNYECPFETGKVTIFFRQDHNVQGVDVAYQPEQSVAVSRGSGAVTFNASGAGGTTNWLIIRLSSTAEQCQQAPTEWLLSEYRPGEHIVEECVVWNMVEYHKVWSSEE